MTAKEIVTEQLRVLKQHGYIPFFNNNPECVETFREQLLLELHDVINSNEVFVANMSFNAVISGKLPDKSAEINFLLQYDYEPIEQLMNLQRVTATIGDSHIEQKIGHISELLSPSDFYETLLPLNEIETKAKSDAYIREKEAALSDAKKLLEVQGYTENNFNNGQNKDSFANKLEAAFEREITKSADKNFSYFNIETSGKMEESGVPYKVRINYLLNPKAPLLVPKKIIFISEGKTTVFECSPRRRLPPLSDIKERIKGNPKVIKAYEIYNRPYSKKAIKVSK